MEEIRNHNVGNSDYSKHSIQPWDVWIEYSLNPFDADIVKRILRRKKENGMTSAESRRMDYQKIIHICQERISQLDKKLDPWNEFHGHKDRFEVRADFAADDTEDKTAVCVVNAVKSDDETKVTEHYQVKPEDLKDGVKGFPLEVVQKMVDRQVEQSNEADVTVFQECKNSGKTSGGFKWEYSIEGHDFGAEVINRKDFDLFFEKYPKVNK